jgi:hypothetical protein
LVWSSTVTINLSGGNYTVTVTDASGCSQVGTVSLSTTSNLNTITSKSQGGDWHTPSTWIGGQVPTANDNVIITSAVYNNIPAYCMGIRLNGGGLTNNDTLYAGGSLINTSNFSASVFNIRISGNFINNSTFTISSINNNIRVEGNFINNNRIQFISNDTIYIDGDLINNHESAYHYSYYYINWYNYRSSTRGCYNIKGDLESTGVHFKSNVIFSNSIDTQEIRGGNYNSTFSVNDTSVNLKLTSNIPRGIFYNNTGYSGASYNTTYGSINLKGPMLGRATLNLNGYNIAASLENMNLVSSQNTATLSTYQLTNVGVYISNVTLQSITLYNCDLLQDTLYLGSYSGGSTVISGSSLIANNIQANDGNNTIKTSIIHADSIEVVTNVTMNLDTVSIFGIVKNKGDINIKGVVYIENDFFNNGEVNLLGSSSQSTSITDLTIGGSYINTHITGITSGAYGYSFKVKKDLLLYSDIYCEILLIGNTNQYIMGHSTINELKLINDLSLFSNVAQWSESGQILSGEVSDTLILTNFSPNNITNPYSIYQCSTQLGISREFHVVNNSQVVFNNDFYVALEVFGDGCDSISGEINLHPVGGTPPYNYNWNSILGNNLGDNPINLSSGTYDVTISDQSGYNMNTSILINSNINLSVTSVTCNGGNDGSATLSLNNGFTGYYTNWGSINPNTLSVGSYTVTVSNNGCSASESFTISEPLAPTVNTSSSNISCFGNSDGTATINITPNNSPQLFSDTQQIPFGSNGDNMSFALNTGSLNQSLTLTIQGTGDLSATNEYLILYDENNNIIQNGIFQYGATNCSLNSITITLSASDIANWSSDGIINFTLDPYYYVYGNSSSCNSFTLSVSVADPWINPTYSWSNGQNTSTVNSLSVGNYSVTATNSKGCSITENINITQPTALNTAVSTTNVDCNGSSNGTASLVNTGGSGNYTTAWLNSVNPNALSAGNHTVTITDGNGCTNIESINITEPNAINVQVITTDASCNGGVDGTATLSISGGVGNYSTNWGAINPNTLSAGTYSVTVTDGNNCSTIETFIISENSALSVIPSSTDVTCNGGNDGTAILNISGGGGNYNINWGSENPNTLSVGNHSVTVTDINGCTEVQNVVISEPSPIMATGVITPTSCSYSIDGQINISPQGGNISSNSSATYLWSNGSTQQNINNLSTGTYTVTITDNNGCTGSSSFTVTSSSPVNISQSLTPVSCSGGNNGTASLNISGGTGNFLTTWSNNANPNALSGGIYTVTITDGTSCMTIDTIVIPEPNPLVINSTVNPISCKGYNDGNISLGITGGTGSYTTIWSNNANPNTLSTGLYTVTVTDANNCTVTETFTITEPATFLSLSSTVVLDVYCNGDSTGVIQIYPSGGSGNYTTNYGNDTIINGFNAGTHTILVTDGNGCTVSTVETITEPTPLELVFFGDTTVLCNGDYEFIGVNKLGGVGIPIHSSQIIWNNGDTLSYTYLHAGTHSVTVTEPFTGCQITDSITLTESSPILLDIQTTDATCSNTNDGTISINVSGGVGNYSYYYWQGLDTNAVNPGFYFIDVVDSNNCYVGDFIVVNSPPQVYATSTINHIQCHGETTGSIDITSFSGGTGNSYTYSWDSLSLYNLSGGSYPMTITDSIGCTNVQTFMVNEPQPLTINSNIIQHVSCYGGNDGEVSVIGQGGFGTYTYNWGGVNPNALVAGTYIITVTDYNNCEVFDTITITEPMLPLINSVQTTNITCNGYNDGKVIANTIGGTGQISYDWGTITDTIAIPAGNHTVVVTDENLCTTQTIFSINEPNPITVQASINNIACHGDSTASISMALNGGVGNLLTNWGDTILNNLSSGSYPLIVTDANGCNFNDTFTVTEPSPLTLTTNVIQHVSCYGGSNGEVSVIGQGGFGTYTYNWGGVNPNALVAGTYIVTVTDYNNCEVFDTITITEPTLLTSNLITTNISCSGGNDGTIALNLNGGIGNYTYNWGSVNPNALAAGTYTVTATDANGCQLSFNNISVTEPTPLINSVQAIAISCNGYNNGKVVANTTGGTGQISYDWGIITDTTAISGGNYTVAVTDENLCTVQTNFSINEPSPITVQTAINHITCYGDSTASLNIAINGGVGNYVTNWGDTILNNLTAGNYPLLITDANGCNYSDTFTINQPTLLTSTTSLIQQIGCYGGNDAKAISTAQGGVGNYNYNWGGFSPNNLSAGNYIVTITDDNQCTTYDSIIVTEPSLLTSNLLTTDILCHGENTGNVSAIILGGTGSYQYNWSVIDTNAILAGTYYLTITDANSCILTDTFIISEPTPLALSLSTTNESCFDANNGLAIATASGGTGSYTLNWNGIDTMALETGNYSVTLSDANGCILSDTFTINQPPEIMTSISTTSPICYNGNDGSVSINATGGTGNFTYNWGGTLTNNLIAGNYVVTITDGSGCQVIDTAIINNPPPIAIGYTLTDVSCFGNNDGTANFNFSGGTAPYIINLDAGVNPSSLNTGDYEITVTDINNCTIIDTFTIGSPNDVTVSIILINATGSNSQDGTINLIVSGDYPPFTYDWSNGATSNNISNLNPDDYTVDITDANGCTFQRIYSVGNLTSTDFKKAIEYIKLFPNPTSSHINLEVLFKIYSEVNITIMDMNGRVLKERNLEGTYITQHFNLDSFSDGLYILRISTESGITYKKFIITK